MWLFLVVLLCAPLAHAGDAQLSGFVREQSGGGIPDASVTVRSELTGGRREVRTDQSGMYSVSSLAPGLYRVTAQAKGFATIIREDVQLESDQNARLDLTMEANPKQ